MSGEAGDKYKAEDLIATAICELWPTKAGFVGINRIRKLASDARSGVLGSGSGEEIQPGAAADSGLILGFVIAMVNLGTAFVNFKIAVRKDNVPTKLDQVEEFLASNPQFPSVRELAKSEDGRKLLRELIRRSY